MSSGHHWTEDHPASDTWVWKAATGRLGSRRWTCSKCGGRVETKEEEFAQPLWSVLVDGSWVGCDEAVVRKVQES